MNASEGFHALHMPVTGHKTAKFAAYWAAYREPIAGSLMIMGLCWPFLFSSVLPVPWWIFPPLAVTGGLIRRRSCPRPPGSLYPLWGFFLVLLGFGLYASVFNPLQPYGEGKLLRFVAFALAAYIGASRQPPLTPDFLKGMRSTLLLTLFFGVIIAFHNRSLFLNAESYGMDRLRESFSVTGFPLVLALAGTCLIPRHLNSQGLFRAGIGLLLVAVVEIFVRGRFDALVLCLLAVLVMVGPPWKDMFIRLALSVALFLVGFSVYQNVLPLLGDSFTYFQWADPSSFGGRTPLYQEALDGFWAHPFGQGIGSFQRVEPFYSYPHNILLEIAYELGIFGLLCMLAIYALVFVRIWRLWLYPPARMLAGILFILFPHMLKAGDIATLAFQWVFLYLLIVTTPLMINVRPQHRKAQPHVRMI
ncbi:MAG: O-antigen ligase family protein [Armatimonadota bacterium]